LGSFLHCHAIVQVFLAWQSFEKIIVKIIHHAIIINTNGNIEGSPRWYNLIIPKMKAYIALSFYIGLKKQANNISHSANGGFHFPLPYDFQYHVL
jgi:hypothetical protein